MRRRSHPFRQFRWDGTTGAPLLVLTTKQSALPATRLSARRASGAIPRSRFRLGSQLLMSSTHLLPGGRDEVRRAPGRSTTCKRRFGVLKETLATATGKTRIAFTAEHRRPSCAQRQAVDRGGTQVLLPDRAARDDPRLVSQEASAFNPKVREMSRTNHGAHTRAFGG